MVSRVEQLHGRVALGITARQISALPVIATATGPGQIDQVIVTSVLPRNDVLEVKRGIWVGMLWQPAIFATVTGSLTDKVSRIGVHALASRTSQQTAGFSLQ
jgi:hypothetical protein